MNYRIREFLSNERHQKFLVPLLAILGGFLVGTIVMIITGKNPIVAFIAIFKSTTGYDLNNNTFNSRLIGEFIVTSAPLILTGLAVGFAFRTGLFNIGAEGQLIMGSLAAIAVGVLIEAPKFIHLPLVILCAALAGALWAFIPGILKAKYNVHEVVTTIMLNYTALYYSNYFLLQMPGSSQSKTVKVAETATLHSEFLQSLTNNSRLHWGFIISIACVIIFWFIINKTVFGYELRAVGFNKEASKYAGMKVNSKIVYSMMISGAFAGLGGALIAVGTFDYGRIFYSFENYGFDGIAVALIGGNASFGILFSGLLFGALKNAQPAMQNVDIPRDVAIIIQASIVFFVAMQYGIKRYLTSLKVHDNINNKTTNKEVLEKPSNKEAN